jgi:RNA-binding protein
VSETDIDEIGLAHNEPADALSSAARRELRARAHPLHPVVSVGQHGMTPAVLHEIDVALTAHELIKVRVFNDDRDAREAMLRSICSALSCAPVQHLGKLLILWRARPEAAEKQSGTERRASKKPAKKPAARTQPAAKKKDSRKRGDGTRTPAVSRRARGQPLAAQDEPKRPPRSPKAPRSAPAAPNALQGKRRAAVPDPTHGSGASPVTRMMPAVGSRVPGRRAGGGPAGVPRAPNPRRRRTTTR